MLQRARLHSQKIQHPSICLCQSRVSCAMCKQSPLAVSSSSSPMKVTHQRHLKESSRHDADPLTNTLQSPYRTPPHRHLPAHTPLRVRRIQNKVWLRENSQVDYGVRRLFKEEIFAIDVNSMSCMGKEGFKGLMDFETK